MCTHNLIEVCGEMRCGKCFEEKLLTEKVFAHNQDFDVVMVEKTPGHKDRVMRARKNGKIVN